MSFWAYVLYIVAGIFLANGIPHFIKGVTGEKHQTPFGNPSSAVVNVVWGSVNFVVAAIILHYLAISYHHVIREAISVGVGGFIVSLALASSWSKVTRKK
jgi:predicted CDP-diglyceride synthetase/phosphatidate cytidylyltransferase